MRPISGQHLSAALVFVGASLFGGAALAAETQSIPNFSGIIWGRNWPLLEEPPSGPGPVSLTPKVFSAKIVGDHTNPILKPEAALAVKKRGETAATANPPNPADRCFPEPTPFLLSKGFGMQMFQQKDEIIMIYTGNNQVRHIRMNSSHPANVTPTWGGDSIGHYEGDTLVVDTVGQKIGPFGMVDVLGTPQGPGLHVVERYRLIDGVAARDAVQKFEALYFPPGMSNPITNEHGRGLIDPDTSKKGLQIEVTVEDPGVFTTPWKTFITYRPTIGERFPESICAENNKAPEVPRADKFDF